MIYYDCVLWKKSTKWSVTIIQRINYKVFYFDYNFTYRPCVCDATRIRGGHSTCSINLMSLFKDLVRRVPWQNVLVHLKYESAVKSKKKSVLQFVCVAKHNSEIAGQIPRRLSKDSVSYTQTKYKNGRRKLCPTSPLEQTKTIEKISLTATILVSRSKYARSNVCKLYLLTDFWLQTADDWALISVTDLW